VSVPRTESAYEVAWLQLMAFGNVPLSRSLSLERRQALTREARSTWRRADLLTEVAVGIGDQEAATLAEAVHEAAWRLMRHLEGPSTHAVARTRPR
jgi:hypothetical protein